MSIDARRSDEAGPDTVSAAPALRRRFSPVPTAPADVPLAGRLSVRPVATLVAGLVVIALLGVVDWATGPDLAFSALYLIPVAAIAASSPGRRAVSAAIVAAATWGIADIAATPSYSTWLVPVWNTATRFAVFSTVATLVSRLQRVVTHERELARTDFLTGAANSRWFSEAATAAVRAATSGASTLIYLDLDDFKAVNDEHGHAGGDDVLHTVGAALRAAVRKDDLVGRLGGDEFALLLLRANRMDAERDVASIVGRVQTALRALDPPVTFSAGAVTMSPPPRDIDGAVDAADALMFDVKRRGKGTVAHRAVSVS